MCIRDRYSGAAKKYAKGKYVRRVFNNEICCRSITDYCAVLPADNSMAVDEAGKTGQFDFSFAWLCYGSADDVADLLYYAEAKIVKPEARSICRDAG